MNSYESSKRFTLINGMAVKNGGQGSFKSDGNIIDNAKLESIKFKYNKGINF